MIVTSSMINGKLKIIFIISKWDFGIIRENLARNDKQQQNGNVVMCRTGDLEFCNDISSVVLNYFCFKC